KRSRPRRAHRAGELFWGHQSHRQLLLRLGHSLAALAYSSLAKPVCCGKPAFFLYFYHLGAKKSHFPSVFSGFALAFSLLLGYSPLRPQVSVELWGESRGWPQRGHAKNQEDKNTRWQLSQ